MGSTADLQRIPSSVDREVGEPVGERAGYREAGAIGQGADERTRTADLLITSKPVPYSDPAKNGCLQVLVTLSLPSSIRKYRLYC
jgi:hypothetical protein